MCFASNRPRTSSYAKNSFKLALYLLAVVSIIHAKIHTKEEINVLELKFVLTRAQVSTCEAIPDEDIPVQKTSSKICADLTPSA